MNTSATWYRMGTEQTGTYAGCVGYDGGPVVGRFAFTTGSMGASALRFVSGALRPAGSTTWASGNADAFRFGLGTDPQEHRNRCSGSGSAVIVSWGETNHLTSGGNLSVQLLPDTTYYLWIYPSAAGYNLWSIRTVDLTLSGSYGNPASPTVSDGFFGEDLSVTISGGSSGASYTVTAECAGRSVTLQNKGTATALSWRPPVADYAPLLPDTDHASAAITVETWYGNEKIGTRSAEITLRFRAEDVGPETAAGWYTHSPYNEGQAALIARYIRGISRAAITFDETKITTKYGASVAGYTVSCGGQSAEAAPWRTPVLSGESSVTLTVCDSRGFTACESFVIRPLAYQAPALTAVSMYRCGSDGTAAEDGRFLAVSATAVCSEIEGENSASIRCRMRSTGGSFGAWTEMRSGQQLLMQGIDPDTNYEVELEVSDTVGGRSTVLRQIPGRKWAMKFQAQGEGVAFGMAPQGAKRLEIPADWEILRGAERYVPLTESGSSGIWRWRKWADGRFELLGSKTVTANFDTGWGGLYRGELLNGEQYPFTVTAIDYAGAAAAESDCLIMGSIGAGLTDTGLLYALGPTARSGVSIPLRVLVLGRWR